MGGQPIGAPTGFHIGVSANPAASNLDEELKRFEADLRTVKAFIDRRGDDVRSGGPLAA